MKERRIKILITLLIFLMLGILFIPFSKYFGVASYSQIMKKSTIRNTLPDNIAAPEAIEAPHLKDVIKAYGNQNVDAIGHVVLPSVSISQPIFVGLTNENMVQGIVTLFPKRVPDQHSLTLIGHHIQYDSHLLFGGIQSLEAGADVYVRYFDDYYTYKVESNRVIKETELSELQDKGPNYIFLITCNSASSTPYRVLVTARKTAHSPKKIQASFADKQKTIQNTHKKTYWTKFLLPLFIVLILTVAFLIYIWKL